MNSNMGKKDRVLRLIIALLLFFLGYNYVTHLAYVFVLYFLAIILTITSMIARCPLYILLEFSSKGYGLDQITKNDIERAVKTYSLDSGQNSEIEKIKGVRSIVKPLKKQKLKSAAVKKVVHKKAMKKRVVKKLTKKAAIKKVALKKKGVVKKTKTEVKKKKIVVKKVISKKKKVSKSKK